jgi:tetratricopeptide (TPR) repeat protein
MLPQKCRRQKRRRLNSRIEGRYALRIPPRLTVSAGVVSGIRLRSFLRCLLFSFTLDYTLINVYWLPTIGATIEINSSNPSRAIELLKVAVPYELGLVPANLEVAALLYPAYVRGQAYLLLHDGNKATVEFQKFLDHRTLVANNPLFALAHLGLARAYATQGDTAKAKVAYQDFLTLWKDADPDIPIFVAAKAEYAKLQ